MHDVWGCLNVSLGLHVKMDMWLIFMVHLLATVLNIYLYLCDKGIEQTSGSILMICLNPQDHAIGGSLFCWYIYFF